MKTIFICIALLSVASVKAQTLKDALFGGKLKTDTGAVIKKGDSLKLRIDTIQKAKTDSLKNDSTKKDITKTDSLKQNIPDTTSKTQVTVPANDNTAKWKQFIDEYSAIIKSEVLPSKKIKSGTYYVLIDYEIELDGTITTVDISCSPESSYLTEQIKKRMMANAPQLSPVLLSNGKPRKAFKKQSLTFVKE